MVLTETLEKQELDRMVENRNRSQKKVVATLPQKAKNLSVAEQGGDIEDEL